MNNPNWYLNKKYDPLEEAIKLYDKILGNYLNINNCDLILPLD